MSAKASTIESLISIVQESRLGESIVSRSDSSLNVSRASPAQSDSSLTDIINYINADLFTSCAADRILSDQLSHHLATWFSLHLQLRLPVP